MKGLILCAGKGTRMRPITYAVPKMLIPVANKPVIHYAIETMRDSGIKEIGFVVSENRTELEPALGNGRKWGMKFDYVMQETPKGIAHAVLCAEDYVGKSDFVLYLGDNLLENGIGGLVDDYRKGKPNAAITLTPVPEPRHFGVAVVKGSRIVSLEEKPKKPKSNLAIVGAYVFDKNVFEAARRIKPSWRGELEITDTISELISMGFAVTPHIVKGWWRDTGQKSDMIEANQAVLDGITTNVSGKVDAASAIEGRVIIAKGATVARSRVRGPAVIGAGAKIVDSYIGPYSSIGEGAVIEGSEIENSIVMSETRISNIGRRLEASLIGNKAV
ncbi:MAG: glucose-1-phosphate thymidylyltransferase, partial [bacterium]